jgi:hypothetical protein
LRPTGVGYIEGKDGLVLVKTGAARLPALIRSDLPNQNGAGSCAYWTFPLTCGTNANAIQRAIKHAGKCARRWNEVTDHHTLAI